MIISGREVYSEIGKKVSEIEREHSRVNDDIEATELRITELNGQKQETFVRLATTYLPSLEVDSISNTLKEMQSSVQRIFQEKQAKRKEMESGMKTAETKSKSLETMLENVNGQLKKQENTRDELVGSVDAILSKNQEYLNLAEKVSKQTLLVQRIEKRLGELAAERDEKLPAYTSGQTETSRRFMYIINHKIDPKNPGSKGNSLVVNSIDNCVAQKANYDALINRPIILEEELETQKKSYAALTSEKRKLEKEQEDKAGLTKVLEKYEATEKEKKKILDEIQQTHDAYVACSKRRSELDNTKDEYYKTAVKQLKDYLGSESIASLRQKALSTPSSEDDNLVAKLDSINEEITKYKTTAKGLISKREIISVQLDNLRRLKIKFDSKNYNSDRSYFPSDFNTGTLITGYLLGRYDASHVDSTISNNHREKPKPQPQSTYHPTYSSPSSHSIGFGGGGGGRSHSIGL